ncbi:unnamed protein product, partial [Didymodactylos carnosus]
MLDIQIYPKCSRLMLQGKIIAPRSIMTCLTKTIKLLNLKHLDLSFYCSGLVLLELLKQSPNIHTIEISSAFLKDLTNIKQLRPYTNNQIKKLILGYHHHFYHCFTREKTNDLLYIKSSTPMKPQLSSIIPVSKERKALSDRPSITTTTTVGSAAQANR